MLFFEAAARVTDAFRELRDTIYPLCEGRADGSLKCFPELELETWRRKWHLEFEDGELCGMVRSWIFQVLESWCRDNERREALRVDCGYWEYLDSPNRPGVGGDRAFDLKTPGWNSNRESCSAWEARVRAGFEEFIQQERRREQAKLERYGAVPFQPENPLAFEWLALSVCARLSDSRIALRYKRAKVTRAAVKKARQRLVRILKMGTLEEE